MVLIQKHNNIVILRYIAFFYSSLLIKMIISFNKLWTLSMHDREKLEIKKL